MVMEDMCVCMSIKCPRYGECMRGDGYKRKDGIYKSPSSRTPRSRPDADNPGQHSAR